MERLEAYFHVKYRDHYMAAEVHVKDAFHELEEAPDVETDTWKAFLIANQVKYGIKHEIVSSLVQDPFSIAYPITIAKGSPPEKGKDGRVDLYVDVQLEMKRDEGWNFRDVMKIPSVKEGEKLAKLIPPTNGVDGKNVKDERVKAIPGKPARVKPGKNVVFHDTDNGYYATVYGQFSFVNDRMQVFPEYIVNETLSLEVGNIDFIGTVIVRGDVPSGFTINAGGDVKIFGLVEAASIHAKGSIHIAEGIAGQGKGELHAGENIQTGYINQAKVTVGEDLYVENSILHSDCTVRGHVYSQRGNIVGGTLSAGKSVEARDIGTRLNTKTEIVLGLNKEIADKESRLLEKKKESEETLKKLKLLGAKLAKLPDDNPKTRLTKLRQRHSEATVSEELEEINEELSKLDTELGDLSKAKLIVRNFIYENVVVAFGKYKRVMDAPYHFVQMQWMNGEISLEPLFEV